MKSFTITIPTLDDVKKLASDAKQKVEDAHVIDKTRNKLANKLVDVALKINTSK